MIDTRELNQVGVGKEVRTPRTRSLDVERHLAEKLDRVSLRHTQK